MPNTDDKAQDEPQKKIVHQHEVVIAFPPVKVPRMFGFMQGFINFIREQGVIGLAVGLVLGTQIKALVDSLVSSFINPLVGLLLPGGGNLAEKVFHVTHDGNVQVFKWGAFVSQLISFIVVAAIVYFGVKGLKLDHLDKKKES
jgi:large conductance mechanosensitive channel protein